jgi:hypothetical protein
VQRRPMPREGGAVASSTSPACLSPSKTNSCPEPRRPSRRGQASEAVAILERSIELGREARTGLEGESQRVAALSEALLSAGDRGRALEAAEESVALARERGNEGMLAICYRVLAEALLASDRPGKLAADEEALDKATAAAEATGFRSELPFIERAREKLVPVG